MGLYAGEQFFALIADDILYFKTDDSSQAEFEALGMQPFRPFGEKAGPMPYYQLPEQILEDAEALRSWAERAVAAARQKSKARAKPKRAPRRRGA